MRHAIKLLLLSMSFLCASAQAQLTSGIIAASRTENIGLGWQSNAGLPPVYPDGEITINPWTPPVRTTICATINPEGTLGTPVAPTDVNSAIAACAAGGVVKLASGSFYFSSQINLGNKSNVTLRGAGADSTKVFWPASTTGNAVNWVNTAGSSGNATWSAGFSQGATSITLSSITGLTANQSTIILYQCDSGYTTSGCGTGEILDNGGVYVCTGNVNYCANQGTTTNAHSQNQVVLVTSISGAGPFIVGISPGLYLPNWSASAGPTATWITTSIGDGLEDMSIDTTGSTFGTALNLGASYGSWIKGVRLIGGGTNQGIGIFNSKSYLVMSNYVYTAVLLTAPTPISIQSASDGNPNSDGLILNNIVQIGPGFEMDGPSMGEVVAYNYWRDGWNASGNETVIGNDGFAHHAGIFFTLVEGNEAANWQDDDIHGSHDFQTVYRNLFFANDPPYTKSSSIWALSFENFSRFGNALGNVLGSATTTNYQSIPFSTATNPVWYVGVRSGGAPPPADVITLNSMYRYGNYDTVNAAVQWNAAEVPSALATATGFQQTIGTGDGATTTFSGTMSNIPLVHGNMIVLAGTVFAYDNGSGVLAGTGISSGTVNYTTGAVAITFSVAPANAVLVKVDYLNQTVSASPFANPVPSSHNLPPSLFMTTTSHPLGGTGLNWWKVCTNYPTCSSSQTKPFPPIGPDVTGGNQTAGFGNDIPAAIAWKNLPIDAFYQAAYSITGATWSAGSATITVSGLPGAKPPVGEFQVTGMNPSGYNGTFQMTPTSTGTTITYTLVSNPGAFVSGGSFLFPDIRQFNELVYQNDPLISIPAPCLPMCLVAVPPPTNLRARLQ